MSENVSAKEAIEAVLAHRVMTEPGFLEHLVLDPGGAARPVISEVIADDGAIDLDETTISVHLETEGSLHLVIPINKQASELAEVSGFAHQPRLDLRGIRLTPPKLGIGGGAGSHTDAYLCTSSGVCVCTGPDECSDEVMKGSF